MMMAMTRFVERIINSPQTRCRSAKQVGLQMSRERQRARVAVRTAAGKLFQMTGPATAKLLIPSVVVDLGTDSVPVWADRRCHLPAIAEIARQSSERNVGLTCAGTRTVIASLYLILWRTGSQWRSRSTGVMRSNFLATLTTRAAAFWTACSFFNKPSPTLLQ